MSGAVTPLPRDRRLLAILFAAVMIICAVLVLGELVALAGHGFPGNDFSVFWAGGRYALRQPLSGLYDPAAFLAFKQQLGGGLSPSPFVYPPSAVLLDLPFALLPLPAAALLWSGAGLALFLAAAYRALKPARLLPLAALATPAGMINLAAGQTGFVCAALVLFGCLALPRRPLWGGMLLGLLTFKPQLALLPLALLPFGPRPLTALAGAATAAAALLLASVAAFGVAPWLAWLQALHGFGGGLAASAAHQHYGASIDFALLDLGLAAPLALTAQALTALAVLAASACALRRGATELATATVLCGMFLVTPYAALYDLPAASLACLLLTAQGWRGGFRAGEALLLLLAWCAPLLALLPGTQPSLLAVATLAALFGLLLRRVLLAQPTSI